MSSFACPRFSIALAILFTLVASPFEASAQTTAPAISTSAAAGALTPLQAALKAVLVNQCALLVASDFDGYNATLTPDFERTGPGPQHEARSRIVDNLKSSAAGGTQYAGCDFDIGDAIPTPTGAFLRYVETDHLRFNSKGRHDTIVNATADFVKAADGSWIQQDLNELGFRNVYGRKFFYQEGTVGTTTEPFNPGIMQAAVNSADTASQISVTLCSVYDGSGNIPPGVAINFTNHAAVTATRVDFAVMFGNAIDTRPSAVGTYSPEAPIRSAFPLGKVGYTTTDATPYCRVMGVKYADGTSWTNPAPPVPI